PQQVWLDPQAEHATDYRPIATAGDLRNSPGRPANCRGKTRAQRKLPHGRRCYLATRSRSNAADAVASWSVPAMNASATWQTSAVAAPGLRPQARGPGRGHEHRRPPDAPGRGDDGRCRTIWLDRPGWLHSRICGTG